MPSIESKYCPACRKWHTSEVYDPPIVPCPECINLADDLRTGDPCEICEGAGQVPILNQETKEHIRRKAEIQLEGLTVGGQLNKKQEDAFIKHAMEASMVQARITKIENTSWRKAVRRTLITMTQTCSEILFGLTIGVGIALIIITLLNLCSCAFATTDPIPEDGPDIQKRTDVEPGDLLEEYFKSDECTFALYADTFIKDDKAAHRKFQHRVTAQYGDKKVSTTGAWPLNSVTVPCRACFKKDMRGYIEYVDDAGLSFLWGCWDFTPDLNVLYVKAIYKKLKHVYIPLGMPAQDLCNGSEAPVTFELQEACQVLPYNFEE
jgi:hypothetical protein